MNSNRRSCLKEPDVCSGNVWSCVGIKPEIIQCAPANRVGVLVLGKSFAVPSHRRSIVGESPWSATVSRVVKRAVICPTGMLRRGVESNIAQVRRKEWKNDFEGLNRPIQVHVKDGILVVPNASRGPCHLITDEESPIVSGIGLVFGHCCARTCPGLDSRLHSDRTTHRRKGEICRAAANRELAIRSVVIHVAFPRVRLAPGVFVWGDVLRFSEIGCAII